MSSFVFMCCLFNNVFFFKKNINNFKYILQVNINAYIFVYYFQKKLIYKRKLIMKMYVDEFVYFFLI